MTSKSDKKSKKTEADIVKDRVAKEVFALKGEHPNLAIVVFGESHEYFPRLKAMEGEAAKCGIDTHLYICEDDSSQIAAEGMIEFLNEDEAIDAIYVQGPAPKAVDFSVLLDLVLPAKLVDLSEDVETDDWPLREARIFESVLEKFKELS